MSLVDKNILGTRPLIPYSYAKKHGVLIERHKEKHILFCVDQPTLTVLMEVRRVYLDDFEIQLIAHSRFNRLLREWYEIDSNSTAVQVVDDLDNNFDLERLAGEVPKTTDLLDQSDDAPVIRLINAFIIQAIKDGASDIHIEAFEAESSVRYRVDGVLSDILTIRSELHNALVSRLKIMSQLDIAEKRLPQDGRMSLSIGEFPIDVRLSILPTQHGERAVLRLLDKQSARLNLTKLGMPQSIHALFCSMINRPNGIVLVTGPTGSGKTTTLYSALNQLNAHKMNIMTIEDPIEYDVPNIGQTQINAKVGLTFASGLRSILRQDPDVVLVGEIRDVETAKISIQASLTGHLVFSTLHTNTAIGSVVRLVDMGVQPFLIASSLVGVLAQRLVRKLCPKCRKEIPLTENMLETIDEIYRDQIDKMYESIGCEDCNHSGYHGRLGVYELIEIDNDLKKLIHAGAGEYELIEQAHKNSNTLFENGLQLILNGETSLSELLRATQK